MYCALEADLRSFARCYSESVDILCLVCTSSSRLRQHLGLISGAYFFEVLLEMRHVGQHTKWGKNSYTQAELFVLWLNETIVFYEKINRPVAMVCAVRYGLKK